MKWYSESVGLLGKGYQLLHYGLRAGEHRISMHVRDGDKVAVEKIQIIMRNIQQVEYADATLNSALSAPLKKGNIQLQDGGSFNLQNCFAILRAKTTSSNDEGGFGYGGHRGLQQKCYIN